MTMTTFTNQPVRLMLANEKQDGLSEVSFRADIRAWLDPGVPAARIPDVWRASVKHEGRSYSVRQIDGVWFHADVLAYDEEEDEDDTEAWDRAMREHNAED
jgi:hypothetical protein